MSHIPAVSIERELGTMAPDRIGCLRFCRHAWANFWRMIYLITVSLPAFAHTPQDAIDALHISPAYDSDSTLFIVVQNSLLRSTNRGASWKQLVSGLDSPHVLSDIAVSPEFSEDNTLFVSTDGGGVYRSVDRGHTWHRFNDNLRQLNIGMLLASAARSEQVVLAAGSSRGLFISTTEQADWHRAMSDDVQITALQLVINGTAHYGLAGDSTGGIWKSDANLEDWQRIAKLREAGAVTSVAVWQLPDATDVLYIGTEEAGVLRTDNEGNQVEHLSGNWPDRMEDCLGRVLAESVPDLHIRDIELAPAQDGDPGIYVTTWNKAVHVSSDGGKSWEVRNHGISCDNQADSYAIGVPHYRDLEVGGAQQADWFLAGFDGLYRSDDDRKSWVQFETLPVSLIRGLGISAAVGSRHALAITTYGGGAYISLDQGQSWSIANDGLITTRLADIEFSPEYWMDGRVFSLSKERLLSGDEIGNGWIAQDLVYRGWRRRIGGGLERHLGFSSEYGTRLFLSDAERRRVWPMQIELSPEFAKDETILVGLRKHGVWKSENAGADWNRNWDGPVDFVTALQISPNFPNDDSAFAAMRGKGIYVSRDGASTWHASNTGFEYLGEVNPPVSPNYVIDPPLHTAIKDVLLVISPGYADDRTVFASSAAGVFRSTDGAQSWVKLPVPIALQDVPVNALGISPMYDVDKTILASFKGRGLFRSTDAGTSFELVGQDLLVDNFDLKFVEFSPSYAIDSIIYGATDEVLLISRDNGDSWSVIDRPVRYEDWRGEDRGPIRFAGDWSRESGPQFSASTQAVSDREGASASLNFLGGAITWLGECGHDGGQARVKIDGVTVATADLYCEKETARTEIANYSGLDDGPHNIVIEVSKDKNPKSSGHRVVIDSLDVSRQ